MLSKRIAFKDPFAELQGAMHQRFCLHWVDTFASKEDSFCQGLKEHLEIWYAKFPAGKKRVRSTRADNIIPGANSRKSAQLEDPDIQDDEIAGPLAQTCGWRC